MQQTIIGVDIGTTNIKAVAFSIEGKQLFKSSRPTPTHFPQPDWAYFKADELWDVIAACLRELTSYLNQGKSYHIAGIAFSSMAEAMVPLDKDGNAIFEIIAWFDQRNVSQVQWWKDTIGLEKTATITGTPIRTNFSAVKLKWIQEHHPEVIEQADCWLTMADFAAYKLSGCKAMDYSLASRTLLLDLSKKQWSTELIELSGLQQVQLPELVPSSTVVGYVTKTASKETGLPEGTPVCAGGHDHVCAALALGIQNVGTLLDSMGTAEGVFVSMARPISDPNITAKGVGQGIHVVPNRSYAMAGVNFSGGSLDWVRELLFSDLEKVDGYEALVRSAKDIAIGSGGVFFLPHLRQANSPYYDAKARGAFLGLTSDVKAGQLARAVFEGLAYEFQQVQDNLIQTFGIDIHTTLATGGGTRNNLLMKIKASLAGKAIHIPNVDEASCLGAAMLAGIGSGVYSSFEAAAEQISFDTITVEAESAWIDYYQSKYQTIYLDLYETLKDLNHKINQ